MYFYHNLGVNYYPHASVMYALLRHTGFEIVEISRRLSLYSKDTTVQFIAKKKV